MIEIGQAKISHAEVVALFADSLEQGQVEIGNRAVALIAVPRITQITVAQLEPSTEVADQNKRPFVTHRMMPLSGIGQVHDQRVVHHRAIPFRHGFQPADELG